MQTFMTHSDFQLTAENLDHYQAGRYSRLWKQVVEAKQLICAHRMESNHKLPDAWIESKDYISQRRASHPAGKMWVGYENELKHYYNILLRYCKEVKKINTSMVYLECLYSYPNSMISSKLDDGVQLVESINYHKYMPWWFYEGDFFRAMRSRLIQKSPEFYLPKFPNDSGFNNSMYLWPVMETKTFRII